MRKLKLWHILVEVTVATALLNLWGVKEYTIGWWIGFVIIDFVLVLCRKSEEGGIDD